MAMVNPGVSIDETLLTPATAGDPVTVPLFIGYTLESPGVTPIETMVPHSVGSLTEAISLFGRHGTLALALRHFFDNEGQGCYVLSLGTGAAEDTQRLEALVAALQSAQMREAIAADNHTGLLLAPEISELNDLVLISGFDAAALWYESWQALLQLCSLGQQRFALLELPDEPSQANELANGLFSAELCQNGAAWWPRLETRYVAETGEANTYSLLSPLPAVAAAIQRNAVERGVWQAPANIPLAETLRPARNILQSQTLLNQQGVSCNLIRSFPGKGIRLWGCRTLLNDRATPWRYIQTRLLANSVESQIGRLARAFMFEPNNALTWMKLKGQVWTWLRQQWLAGMLYGATEEEAFTLSIGLNETMSAEDISAGKMILRVQLALLAPAEFIDINLMLDMRDGAETASNGS